MPLNSSYGADENSVPVSALTANSIARIGAHSDFGSITLLLQDDVGGLEVEDINEPGVFRVSPFCLSPFNQTLMYTTCVLDRRRPLSKTRLSSMPAIS